MGAMSQLTNKEVRGLVEMLDERASAYIDEKRLSETKVSLTLTATGWGKGGLCFRLEAWFGELQDGYRFEGMFNPSDRKIRDWKISKAK